MKTRSLLLIMAFSLNASAGSLSGKQIEAIRQKVQKLPDEIVEMNEVAVIETDFGTIILKFFPFAAPLHAMNFKKLTTAGTVR